MQLLLLIHTCRWYRQVVFGASECFGFSRTPCPFPRSQNSHGFFDLTYEGLCKSTNVTSTCKPNEKQRWEKSNKSVLHQTLAFIVISLIYSSAASCKNKHKVLYTHANMYIFRSSEQSVRCKHYTTDIVG